MQYMDYLHCGFFDILRRYATSSIEPPNEEPTCPTVQSTQIITKREKTGELIIQASRIHTIRRHS